MKIAVNKCFGGFGLSPLAIKRLAELQGKQAYFFEMRGKAITLEQAEKEFFWTAFSSPDKPLRADNWNEMTDEQKDAHNAEYTAKRLDAPDDRSDPMLIQIIEELGDKANSKYAKLEIVEVPDGIDWEIEEYDGLEHIAEKHRTW